MTARVALMAAAPGCEATRFVLAALRATVPSLDTSLWPEDASQVAHLLADAGLTDIRVESAGWHVRCASGRDLWDAVSAVAEPTATLRAEELVEVQRVLDGMLREHAGGTTPVALRMEVHVASATRPVQEFPR